MSLFIESSVEKAALAGLESIRWHVAHWPDFAPIIMLSALLSG